MGRGGCCISGISSGSGKGLKSGVAQEAVQNIRRASNIMAEPEARQILGVEEHSSWEEILQKYDNLFVQNVKLGAFTFSQRFIELKNV